ncbi:MAG: glutamine--fructose-6-phosphate transaminase (isomerizing) [Pseudomonadota bacterium]
MCGIVGYVGSRNVPPILLDGLKRLEYRGYDSAGIAVVGKDGLDVLRCEGKLCRLEDALAQKPLTGTTGIGHTRWATHGRPSDENAHPHVTGRVAVVHNGILENYIELKQRCIEKGRTFSSETDTEVLAHLVDMNLAGGMDFLEAVRKALREVEGSYAVAVLSDLFPDRIILAKNASPLVLGLGDGENFAASDIPAILPYTKRMVFLDEQEIAVISSKDVTIQKLDGREVRREAKTIHWSLVQAEKSGYKHFMLKEIFEQPRAVEDTIRGRLTFQGDPVVYGALGVDEAMLRSCGRLLFLACGTSYHAAVYGRYLTEKLGAVLADAELASEFRNRSPVVREDDLVVAISQSGETIDTLQALKIAKEKGATILSIVNVLDSAIARASDMVIYTHAGPEIGVASTKCFTAQLTALVLLAAAVAAARDVEGKKRGEIIRIIRGLVKIPLQMNAVLGGAGRISDMSKKFIEKDHFLYLGRGLGFPIAMEGALKLKEISYIHAEAYAAGEMKHGPIALIDAAMPVVIIIPADEQYDKIKGNLQEVKARQGIVIALTTEGGVQELRDLCDEVIEVPECEPELLPLLTVLPLQLFAYYIADCKGTDVDQPRNLAKTVTVE